MDRHDSPVRLSRHITNGKMCVNRANMMNSRSRVQNTKYKKKKTPPNKIQHLFSNSMHCFFFFIFFGVDQFSTLSCTRTHLLSVVLVASLSLCVCVLKAFGGPIEKNLTLVLARSLCYG